VAAFDIVGHIWLESGRRLAYLVSSIRSIAPLAPLTGRFLLNIENGQGLVGPLRKLVYATGFRQADISALPAASFGSAYVAMLQRTSADFIMHFEEDHFCVLNETAPMTRLLDFARSSAADVVPLSLFRHRAERFAVLSPEATDSSGRLFHWDQDNFSRMLQHIPPGRPRAFFIGNNWLFSRQFALAYWMRPIPGKRPHPFELYDPPEGASLRLLLPSFEILRPIDDDHGIPGSCCLHSGEEKWTRLSGEGLCVGAFRYHTWRAFRTPALKTGLERMARIPKTALKRVARVLARQT
jgi:hypothetical protein